MNTLNNIKVLKTESARFNSQLDTQYRILAHETALHLQSKGIIILSSSWKYNLMNPDPLVTIIVFVEGNKDKINDKISVALKSFPMPVTNVRYYGENEVRISTGIFVR